jgi:hypothetical protein
VLGDLEQLREPELLAAAIAASRELWSKLYQASLGREDLGGNAPSAAYSLPKR